MFNKTRRKKVKLGNNTTIESRKRIGLSEKRNDNETSKTYRNVKYWNKKISLIKKDVKNKKKEVFMKFNSYHC